MSAARRGKQCWLVKSEPDVYSIDDLERDGKTMWDGVRNYQARNLLRDDIQVGDGVLYYHSNAKPTAVVGVARVIRGGYPDHTAFDTKSKYHDPDSAEDDPRWFMVDIAPVAGMSEPIDRDQLKDVPELEDMMVLRRGARLSVQPVTPAEWRTILKIGKVKESW